MTMLQTSGRFPINAITRDIVTYVLVVGGWPSWIFPENMRRTLAADSV
jgi:hypothetical protein